LLTATQARNFYEHIFRIPAYGEPILPFVGLPKNVLSLKVAEAQSAVIVRVSAGRLSSPLRPRHAEPRTHKTTDGEGATEAYIANEAAFHNLRFCRSKEHTNHLRSWSMDVVPVNDVAGTPSQFWSDEPNWVGGDTGRARAVFIEQITEGQK
jgi:hypothetical protein